MVVCGERDETSARPLKGGLKTILNRGESDSFLMAVPRPLGQLQYIRVWHDNSGHGAEGSWFLNYVMIRDLQTKDRWNFVANKWLAVEEDDGEVCTAGEFTELHLRSSLGD